MANFKNIGLKFFNIVKILLGINIFVNLLIFLNLVLRVRADFQKEFKLVSPEINRNIGQIINLVTTNYKVVIFVGLV